MNVIVDQSMYFAGQTEVPKETSDKYEEFDGQELDEVDNHK